MSTIIYPIKAFNDNYIWTLINDSNKQAIVIDPGQATPVIEYLEEYKLELTAIWITHHHHDHVGGVSELREHYPMTHVVAHEAHGIKADQTVKEGSNVNAWGGSASVWEVAGHTEHHLAYVLEKDKKTHVFIGDTLFSAGSGKVLGGSIEALYKSFKRINELPEETLLYPAHEYTANNLKFGLTIEPNNIAMHETLAAVEQITAEGRASLPVTLAHEREVNVFLRCKEPSVIEGVSRHTDLENDKPLTVFAALRELKDNF